MSISSDSQGMNKIRTCSLLVPVQLYKHGPVPFSGPPLFKVLQRLDLPGMVNQKTDNRPIFRRFVP